MNNLYELYETYKDHCDKGTKHSYIDFYEGLFLPYKNKPINILEVGVQRGASLMLWQDYFPNAKNIIGVDVDTSQVLEKYRGTYEKITLIEGDSTSADLLEAQLIKENEFDIIVEDGDHFFRTQMNTFDNLYQKLKVGGVYVVEDVLKAGAWRFLKHYKHLNPLHLNFVAHRSELGRHSLQNQLIVFFKHD
jgi:cephalosporin hydroxylase